MTDNNDGTNMIGLKLFHHSRARTIGYPFRHVKGHDCGEFSIDSRIIDRLNEPRETHTIPAPLQLTDGAQREGRTPTLLREPDFESGASASSAIRAQPIPKEKCRIFLTRSHVRVNQSLPSFLKHERSATIQDSHSLL